MHMQKIEIDNSKDNKELVKIYIGNW